MLRLRTPTTSSQSPWEGRWATAADWLRGSAIREMLKLTEQQEMISFAGGMPAPESFPAEELAAAAELVLATQASRALQYGPTEGFAPLRTAIAALLCSWGQPASADQVLITNGSQQALDMLGKLFLDPGSIVLVEEPTYMGALQAWRPYKPIFISLPMDEQGLRPDGLEKALNGLQKSGQRPAFLYTVSTFHNPTGITMSAERRLALMELIECYDLPLVEDDPYSRLRYSGEPLPSLATLDIERWGAPRFVIYLSTFSKLLAPGLRLGWITAPAALQERMVQAKQGLDLQTGTLAQVIAAEVLEQGTLDYHIPVIQRLYQERRDVMLSALERSMPAGVSWSQPAGGLFVWVTLPPQLDAGVVLQHALRERVAFVAGAQFFANGGGENTMRLNFSHATPPTIDEGIARLGRVVELCLEC